MILIRLYFNLKSRFNFLIKLKKNNEGAYYGVNEELL